MTITDKSSNLSGQWTLGEPIPNWVLEGLKGAMPGQDSNGGRIWTLRLDSAELDLLVRGMEGQTASLSAQVLANQVNWDAWQKEREEVNRIALYFREHYQPEIAAGLHQHQGSLAEAVIYYLRRERGTLRAVLHRIWYGLMGGGK